MIKLIASDVDDTLVPEGSVDLNPEYFEIIRALQEKGIMFVAASGRQIHAIQKAFSPIKNEIAFIADNGTHILTKDFEHSRDFGDENYMGLVKDFYSLKEDCRFMACKPGQSFINASTPDFVKMMSGFGFEITPCEDIIDLKGIGKATLYHEFAVPKHIEKFFKEKWSDKMDVALAGKVFLDFSAKGANKGSALSLIQEHYGIKPEETMTFGNADNDIPMIRQSKYGYAVAQGSDKLKKEAYGVIGEMRDNAVLSKLKEVLNSL